VFKGMAVYFRGDTWQDTTGCLWLCLCQWRSVPTIL